MPTEPLRLAVVRVQEALAGDPRPDGELLSQFVAHRDQSAFAELVKRHGPMVFGVCRRVLGDHHLAEDAVQAAFVVLAHRAAAVNPPGAVGDWLYGVAYRTALEARTNAFRRQSRERTGEFPEPPAPEADGDLAELRAVLDDELAALPGKYRSLLVACDLEGRARREVAQSAGLVEGTLSSRLTTARRLLAARLLKRGVVPSTAAVLAVAERSAAEVPRSVLDLAAKFGQAGEVGAVPASVAALASRVTRAMTMSKVKYAAVVFGLVLATAGAVTAAVVATDGPTPENAQTAPPATPPAEKQQPPATPPAGAADPTVAKEPPASRAEELKWAKGIAEDFMNLAFAGDIKHAAALIDTSLQESYAKEGERALWEWLNNSIAIRGYSSPTIREELISPVGDEASFRGEFKRVEELMPERKYTFILRVVKEKDSGKWRVSLFTFREVEKKGRQ